MIMAIIPVAVTAKFARGGSSGARFRLGYEPIRDAKLIKEFWICNSAKGFGV